MKKFTLYLIVSIAIISLTILSSCEKAYYVPVPIEPIEDNVSFSEDIMPIFEASCVICHNNSGTTPPDLSSGNAYANLFPDMIDTSDPASSVLYIRMIDTVNPMPTTGVLSAGEPEMVLTWIEEGALDN